MGKDTARQIADGLVDLLLSVVMTLLWLWLLVPGFLATCWP